MNVYMPKDRVTGTHQGYGFVEFRGEEDADYACKVLISAAKQTLDSRGTVRACGYLFGVVIGFVCTMVTPSRNLRLVVQIMNMIKLFSKPVRVNKSAADRKTVEIGANLFIGARVGLCSLRTAVGSPCNPLAVPSSQPSTLSPGNLDPELDEKLLYDTFSAFGVIVNTPKIMRDPETVRFASRKNGAWLKALHLVGTAMTGEPSPSSTGQQQGLRLRLLRLFRGRRRRH